MIRMPKRRDRERLSRWKQQRKPPEILDGDVALT
jgi:hypothetical protein